MVDRGTMTTKHNEQIILDIIKISKKISAKKIRKKIGLSEDMIRKSINSLRTKSVPIIADSTGYFLSFKRKDIEKQIKSYECRIQAMICAKKGLEKLLKRIESDNSRAK